MNTKKGGWGREERSDRWPFHKGGHSGSSPGGPPGPPSGPVGPPGGSPGGPHGGPGGPPAGTPGGPHGHPGPPKGPGFFTLAIFVGQHGFTVVVRIFTLHLSFLQYQLRYYLICDTKNTLKLLLRTLGTSLTSLSGKRY